MAVTCKPTVRLVAVTPALAEILAAILAADAVFPEDMVITSINDSRHAPTSAHYRNEAVDLRCNDRPRMADLALHRYLQQRLGPKFLVLYEGADTPNEHLHMQLRQGATWP